MDHHGLPPTSPLNDVSEDFIKRFSGIARLYGHTGLRRFHDAHVCVIGVGGVGSWIVESLARSGIGALTLIDLDDVCVTNINRQLPALTSTVGQSKVSVLAERVALINPECRVTQVHQFISESNARQFLDKGFSLIVDAVDRMSIKAAIIATAQSLAVPVITCGAAGGRTDPTLIKVADLGMAGYDSLLQQVRRKLRKDYGFPSASDGKALAMNVPCVYSTEKPVYAHPDGSCSVTPPAGTEAGLRLDCSAGYGAATHVTGAFAFAATSAALGLISAPASSAAP